MITLQQLFPQWQGEAIAITGLATDSRQVQPGLLVFGMTGGGPGLSTETMLTLAEIWGAQHVFYKPFDDAALLATLAAIPDLAARP